MSKPIITLIAAVADNGVIGSSNELPWYLPEDLKHFKKITDGHTVVMGKKTFDSIMTRLGKPLPNRKNIVITRDTNFQAPPEVIIVHDPKEILTMNEEEIMIIGGGQIYNEFMPIADRLHITHVHTNPEGDVQFPEINWEQWKQVSEEKHEGYSFASYEKN